MTPTGPGGTLILDAEILNVPEPLLDPTVSHVLGRLQLGETVELVSDRDPTPLRRLLDGLLPGQYRWDMLEAGPDRWRLRFGLAGLEAETSDWVVECSARPAT